MPRMRATQCCVVESGPRLALGPLAPVTWIPSFRAAGISMDALRRPVVRRIFRFGNSLSNGSGKGVRSRMEAMAVKGLRRVMSSFFWVSVVAGWLKGGRVSLKTVMSNLGFKDSKCGGEMFW